MQNGFLGITVSSEQVGWAVTNPKYELERASRKDLWGVRLFVKQKQRKIEECSVQTDD